MPRALYKKGLAVHRMLATSPRPIHTKLPTLDADARRLRQRARFNKKRPRQSPARPNTSRGRSCCCSSAISRSQAEHARLNEIKENLSLGVWGFWLPKFNDNLRNHYFQAVQTNIVIDLHQWMMDSIFQTKHRLKRFSGFLNVAIGLQHL